MDFFFKKEVFWIYSKNHNMHLSWNLSPLKDTICDQTKHN